MSDEKCSLCDLMDKLDKIKEKIEEEKIKFAIVLLGLNSELNKHDESIKKITERNNDIVSQLKKIKNRIDCMYEKKIKKNNKVMKKNIKVHSLETVEDMKNKQQSSMNKLINALKIDINKYKAEIKKEYNIEKLELELSDKKDTIEKLNKDIIALKIIKEIHMTTCEKKIERLKEKLNQVKKEHKDLSKETLKKKKISNVKHIVIQKHHQMKKNFSDTNLIKQPLPFSEFEKIQKQLQLKSRNIIDCSYNSNNISLFKSEEHKILEKIIPIEAIDKYKLRFNSIDNQRKEIESKLFKEKEYLSKEKKKLSIQNSIYKRKLSKSFHTSTLLQKQFFINEMKIKNLRRLIKEYTFKLSL